MAQFLNPVLRCGPISETQVHEAGPVVISARGKVDVFILIRREDGLKVIRKHIEHGEARTAVWRKNGRPLTLQSYRNGTPTGAPMPAHRRVERWAEAEARRLLADPTVLG